MSVPLIDFTQNYSDLTTDQGFQFRFYCDRCGNGYQSSLQPNRLETAGNLLRAAGNMLGGVLGRVSDSTYNIERAVGGPAHNHALQSAAQEVRPQFAQCPRCSAWVCHSVCWDAAQGECKQCATAQADEAARAQAQAAPAAAAPCSQCGATTTGGKFCPECGATLAVKTNCAECNAHIPSGAKFCPECGARA